MPAPEAIIVAGHGSRLRDTPHMAVEPVVESEALESVRAPVDAVLGAYLDACGSDLGRIDPHARLLVDEIARLVSAGGKRLRPAFCIWAFRAARGPDVAPGAGAPAADEPIVRAAAALELLHTMALIHDDLIDAAATRRGVRASAPHLAAEGSRRGFAVDPTRFGQAGALLAGDLAAVLADRLLLTSGFEPSALARALVPYHEMRLDMAAGQFLDVTGLTAEPATAMRAARLKGGTYTVEGPLMVGVALAGECADVRESLRAFAIPLGHAFQLRDDLHDGDGRHGATPATVNELVERARSVLHGAAPDVADPAALEALDRLAALVAMA